MVFAGKLGVKLFLVTVSFGVLCMVLFGEEYLRTGNSLAGLLSAVFAFTLVFIVYHQLRFWGYF